ncbi:unnamed protein product [Mycetohabitans rhizoxinica HKI 454]|uniref:Uncharacterized protein n=1 Tax=Mycetohabitans rhizoxinica (strain DSM 19002 / CIP 109453 / HKI 454) TaxID=882378 RepID=E5ARB2_MYCRK|nr:unnamed protein product [Mycetohabitans rhizoxinica HKI 454]
MQHGIALVTEDRKEEGLLLTQSVSANLALGNLQAVSRRGVIDARRELALARRHRKQAQARAESRPIPMS